MKPEQKSLAVGAAVIAFAAILRMFASGPVQNITKLLISPEFSSAMLYLGTGRVYRRYDPPAVTQQPPAEIPEPTEKPEPVQAVFSEDDALLVSLTNYPGYDVDVAAMLSAPLTWDLSIPEPTVLIYHSHTSESYQNTENYTESDPYRTRDAQYNMVSIGAHLKTCLEEKGITVIHDTGVYDYPSYNDAYSLSRKSVAQYLSEFPSLCLVLDIHRDAYEDGKGNQVQNTVTINGVRSSRLMVLAGTDNSSHPRWQENLSAAVKLQAVIEKRYPGLCRPVTIRSSVFNQDLSPGALLIEIGTAGDTRQDALNAAEFLADGIAALTYGSQ